MATDSRVVSRTTTPSTFDDNRELHLAVENPLNRYVPLVEELEPASEEPADEIAVADEIVIDSHPEPPETVPDNTPQRLSQASVPEPIEHAPDNVLPLDLKTTLEMAWSAEGAREGQVLDAALKYLAMLEAIHHSRIMQEAIRDIGAVASIASKLPLPVEEHQASADRLNTQLLLLKDQRQLWEGYIAKSTSGLRRSLNLESHIKIVPIGLNVAPIQIVNPQTETKTFIQTALSNRSEFQRSPELVHALCEAFADSSADVITPSLLLQEVDLIDNGEDVAFAAGSTSSRSDTFEMMDAVAMEVGETHAEIVSSTSRIEILQQAIASAERSFTHSLERLEAGEGLVVEAQQSVVDLYRARQAYLEAVMDHNQAQFRLQQTLGWPSTIESVDQPATISE